MLLMCNKLPLLLLDYIVWVQSCNFFFTGSTLIGRYLGLHSGFMIDIRHQVFGPAVEILYSNVYLPVGN